MLIVNAVDGHSIAASAAPVAVDYRFRLEHAPDGAPIVDVRLTMRGNRDGSTSFIVPSTWAGQDSLRNAIVLLEVAGPATMSNDSDGTITVHHAPAAPLSIHYVLRQDWRGPIRFPLYHRVIVDSSYVIFNGQNGMIVPRLPEDARLSLRCEWDGIPSAWRIITSFGNRTNCAAQTSEFGLRNASFVAGRFRILNGSRDDRRLLVATDGHWRFSDSGYFHLQHAVWEQERAFWADDPFPHGFVVLVPAIQRGTVGGTAFTAGFLEFADTASALAGVVRSAAHEMLHFWNGQRMHAPDPEGPYKWFTEGFTDYYADRFFRDGGGISQGGFVAQANRTIGEYYLSSHLGSTRADVTARYWSSQDAQLYPYRQGYVFALYLQSQLRRLSAGRFDIDSLVRRTYRATRAAHALITDSLLLANLPRDLRDSVADAITRYIDHGEAIPGAPGALGKCVALGEATRYHFDLGFDATKSIKEKAARGVTPGGPAAQAGLREGMPLAGYGWFNDDPTKEATLTVTDSGTKRVIKYLPKSGAPVTIPQFAYDSARPGCPE